MTSLCGPLPVMIPSRATAQLVQRLRQSRLSVLNQAVLLRGINDDAETLIELSERLFEAGILPYYLHLLDPVAGAHHMLVDNARGRALYAVLRTRLPGYLVPRLARETPGQTAKDWLLP